MWHVTRLALVPTNFDSLILESLRPYIWCGQRYWLRKEYLLAPRHVGGLGLTHPQHMVVSASAAVVLKWIFRQDAAGAYFRQQIHDRLRHRFNCTEAIFLTRVPYRFDAILSMRGDDTNPWDQILSVLARIDIQLDHTIPFHQYPSRTC